MLQLTAQNTLVGLVPPGQFACPEFSLCCFMIVENQRFCKPLAWYILGRYAIDWRLTMSNLLVLPDLR